MKKVVVTHREIGDRLNDDEDDHAVANRFVEELIRATDDGHSNWAQVLDLLLLFLCDRMKWCATIT